MPSTPSHFAIAIDGPAASGKSTLAHQLATRLCLVMVNSGAMYRAVTWQVLQQNIDPPDAPAVLALLAGLDIQCGDDGLSSSITINGRDPGDALRSEAVNANVSAIAAIPKVREVLVARQREYVRDHNLVMEGRDIGSVVLPDAEVRIFLEAAADARAYSE